jgi:outer membrane protein assembly factor BamB
MRNVQRGHCAGPIASVLVLLLLGGCLVLQAEDWPELRGKGRQGVWTETGILERFPATGLNVLWRTPIRSGFSGPSVADGRVYAMDYLEQQRFRGIERALALDEKTGKILWTREWPVAYPGVYHPIGPRATPTADGDRVYFAGGDGKLVCLRSATGEMVWQRDFMKEYGAELSAWGFSSSPIVDGNRLIALVGGQPDARMVAFDKMTGKEIWRALPSNSEPGVASPVIIEAGGARQLIIYYDGAVASLDPVTGKIYWQQPYRVGSNMSISTPVRSGSLLFFTNFYHGPLMLRLDEKKPAATVMWRGQSDSEIQTEGLHSVNGTPIIVGDHVYGVCSYGQFRCLRAETGERVWESQELTKERTRWASAFIVRHGERLFINNDRGELIIVAPGPEGYKEIDRTQLIKPTTAPTSRRALGALNWSEPAYANRHIYARNDEEIICASLAADGK